MTARNSTSLKERGAHTKRRSTPRSWTLKAWRSSRKSGLSNWNEKFSTKSRQVTFIWQRKEISCSSKTMMKPKGMARTKRWSTVECTGKRRISLSLNRDNNSITVLTMLSSNSRSLLDSRISITKARTIKEASSSNLKGSTLRTIRKVNSSTKAAAINNTQKEAITNSDAEAVKRTE